MLVVIKKDYEEVSREAAHIVAGAVRAKPAIILGLATGSTPLGLYQELIALHRAGTLDFSLATSFNLDEYLGLSPSHPQSFHYFMDQKFFSQVNLAHERIHIPDGTISGDYDSYCNGYEQCIRSAGGIDLQILGIGRNGHVGFNEPTSSLASRTRLKALSRETIEDNRHFFASESEMPKCAITMGIGTILDSRRVLLCYARFFQFRKARRRVCTPRCRLIRAECNHRRRLWRSRNRSRWQAPRRSCSLGT